MQTSPTRRTMTPSPQRTSSQARGTPSGPPPFAIGRFSDNELVLFDEAKQESWIVYPPRSAYDFLPVRRPSKTITVVEHHPWAPLSVSTDHHLRPRDACLQHGLACPANTIIQAAVDLGFDPFA